MKTSFTKYFKCDIVLIGKKTLTILYRIHVLLNLSLPEIFFHFSFKFHIQTKTKSQKSNLFQYFHSKDCLQIIMLTEICRIHCFGFCLRHKSLNTKNLCFSLRKHFLILYNKFYNPNFVSWLFVALPSSRPGVQNSNLMAGRNFFWHIQSRYVQHIQSVFLSKKETKFRKRGGSRARFGPRTVCCACLI